MGFALLRNLLNSNVVYIVRDWNAGVDNSQKTSVGDVRGGGATLCALVPQCDFFPPKMLFFESRESCI